MKKTIKLILDTDIGGDCDDAGMMAMMHRLCDVGEGELLGVTHCYASPYLAGCIDAINTYYRRRVPIGVNYEYPLSGKNVYDLALCEEFPNAYPAADYETDRRPPDSVRLIRRLLADAEDQSVTLVATGKLYTLARLIMSEADELSPLTGRELVGKKLLRTVIMGGRFFESWPMPIFESNDPTHQPVTWEWNIYHHGKGVAASQTVLDNWEGELVLASYEIGAPLITMKKYILEAPCADPVRRAYELHSRGVPRGRSSWDHTAMLEAIRPDTYWNYHEYGRISVDEGGITSWKRDPTARHTYLLPRTDHAELCDLIDALVDHRRYE